MKHVDDLLARRLAGTLDAAGERALADHLRTCDRCRRLARRQAALWDDLAAGDGDTPVDGVDLRPALRARLGATASPLGRGLRLATVALALVGIWVGGRLGRPAAEPSVGWQALSGSLLWEETAATLDGLLTVAAAPVDAGVPDGDVEPEVGR